MTNSVFLHLKPFAHGGNDSLWIMRQGFVLEAVSECKYRIVGMFDEKSGMIMNVYKYVAKRITSIFDDVVY